MITSIRELSRLSCLTLLFAAPLASAQGICCVDGSSVCCPAGMCCGGGCEACHVDNENDWHPGEQYTCPADHPVNCNNGRCCDSAHPNCCPQGMCSSTASGCDMPKTCPADHPRECGSGHCCDSSHPRCCSDGSCCDTAHPYCCGNGKCCDAAHQFCCSDGSCAASLSDCPSDCPRGYQKVSGTNSTSACCPSGYTQPCADGSCDISPNCHGKGLLGTKPKTNNNNNNNNNNAAGFTCADTQYCSQWISGSKCNWRACSCANSAAGGCAQGWYETNSGRVFSCTQCVASCQSAAMQLIATCN